MMKRAILFGFIFLLAIAVIPVNALTSNQLPGVTCGNASSTSANQCCTLSNGSSIEKQVDEYADSLPCLISSDIYGDHMCVGTLAKPIINGLLKLGRPDRFFERFKREVQENPCTNGVPQIDSATNQCTCVEKQVDTSLLCDRYLEAGSPEHSSCIECSTKGVWTAVGCIRADVVEFVKVNVFGFMLGLAGLVAFLCILYSAFILQTSRGNAEKVQKAREYLTSCIIGLLLILFSIAILQVFGDGIFGIPGFG